jgi:SecD/SecF fusion protein
MSSPRLLGAGEQRVRWNFDFTGLSRWFFSMSGAILAISAISFATAQLNFGIDFESGTRIKVALAEPAEVEQVRTALDDAGAPEADGAKIQEVEEPAFGENVFQISTQQLQPDGVGAVQDQLSEDFGLEGGESGFQSDSVGPTFGEQIARSAVLAIIFSFILIAGYVAFRFEAKYAIPVIIAVIHDILITAGVYSLTDREVTSATVAAFLTILGYSLYDTVIVFDRIRENVPRMPRAAFSQIVNRSMSEVLTRSLITGLSTVFLITVILIFGGDTLKDFAFAMMVGVLSGTYSSIFIASPVLTAWKEREPGFIRRRLRIAEAEGGVVPAFADDMDVARLGGEEEPESEPALPAGQAEDAAAEPAPGAVATAERTGGNGGDPAAGDGDAESAERRQRNAERKARRQARRKHGRKR